MKHLLFFFCCIFSISTVSSQDMAAYFVAIPDQYLPQLEDAWRKDLVELYQSGKPAVLDNAMDGRSTLQKLTSDYLLLQTTERSAMEIRLLPLINNTFIACMIRTVFAPAADSRVEFFTMDWQPLPATEIWSPAGMEGFFKEGIDRDEDAYREARSFLDMELIHYQLDPDQLVIKATCTTPEYLSPEERKKVKPFLKDSPKVYTWKTGRFE